MEKTLDLKVIFYILRRKIVWVVIVTVIGALIAFLYTSNMVPERFTSSAQIYISNTEDNVKVEYSDLSTAKSLANTYCIILKSDKANTLLKEKLANNEKFLSIGGNKTYNTSVTVVKETEVLSIAVSSYHPEISAIVCNAVVDVSVDLISEIFPGGRSHPLEVAKPNYTPASPNVRSAMAIGGIVAFATISIFIVFWTLLDNRVKDEHDFVLKVNIPVLGEVPSIHDENTGKENYYYYAYPKKTKDK